MPIVSVTGHSNPDTDSIASAIGYAELRWRLDPPQRLVAGAPHVLLRVCDVRRSTFPTADNHVPVEWG